MPTTATWRSSLQLDHRRETDLFAPVPARIDDADALAAQIEARRLKWLSAAGSLLLHASLLLILAAWLLPRQSGAETAVIETTMGAEEGAADAFALVEIDALDAARQDRPLEQFFNVAAASAAAIEPADIAIDELPAGLSTAATAEAGDATGDGRGSVGFFGTEAEGQSFVFIIDYSGSMRGHRFSRACDELLRAMEDLTPQQKFFVIFYNHAAQPMYVPGNRHKLVPASRAALRRARRWIEQQQAGGGTVPHTALKMALDMQPDVVFFLSDGEFERTARTVAKESNKHGAIIHTIAFEFKGSEPLLKGIAEDNRGRYRFVE